MFGVYSWSSEHPIALTPNSFKIPFNFGASSLIADTNVFFKYLAVLLPPPLPLSFDNIFVRFNAKNIQNDSVG